MLDVGNSDRFWFAIPQVSWNQNYFGSWHKLRFMTIQEATSTSPIKTEIVVELRASRTFGSSDCNTDYNRQVVELDGDQHRATAIGDTGFYQKPIYGFPESCG
jgi:hypothetical protein